MLEKIYHNWNIKPISDEQQVLNELAKKSKTEQTDKKNDDYFNVLLEEKIAFEKNMQNMKKRAKKQDDPTLLMVPPYSLLPGIINDNQIRIGKGKRVRCARCGNIVASDDSVEVNLEKRNTFFCSKCMNKEIADFLKNNYL